MAVADKRIPVAALGAPVALPVEVQYRADRQPRLPADVTAGIVTRRGHRIVRISRLGIGDLDVRTQIVDRAGRENATIPAQILDEVAIKPDPEPIRGLVIDRTADVQDLELRGETKILVGGAGGRVERIEIGRAHR